MKYILMVVSILLSVANACLLRGYSQINKYKGSNPFSFNFGISCVWIFILALSFAFSDTRFSTGAIVFGGIYGIILFAFLFFKTQSVAAGPVSLSTLIGSCAFVIATWFGVIYANESVNCFQITGMVMLVVSLVLCVNPKKSKEKLTWKWLLYCIGFFISGGFVGILYKLFGISDAKADIDGMLLTAAIVSALLFGTVGLICEKKERLADLTQDKKCLMFVILSGIASCVYIRLNVSLSAIIPSVVFFPVSNGGMVILSTIAGKFIFNEKLNKIQLLGISIGCLAVVVTGCGDVLHKLIVSL